MLRRLDPAPASPDPIDRWYSDDFLRRQAGIAGYVTGDFAGDVLEVVAPGRHGGEPLAKRIGERGTVGAVRRVTLPEVLCATPASGPFDAVACCLALQFASDLHTAVERLSSCLASGGVLLLTVPGIAPLASTDGEWPERWRLTPLAVRRLLEEVWPPESVTVHSFGNLLTATAHLHGLGARDLRRRERELHDPYYPVVVAARAVGRSS
jgi:hypothetical protein